tara:strand:- start:14931 stop:15437 length:507 start_codon:yes stop_codon:yes gene_type:complete
MDLQALLKLKTVLSDINNIVTMKLTLAFVDWLSEKLCWNEIEKSAVLKGIYSTKPNTNGFDLEANVGTIPIIAEVKCNIPVNGGDSYGAAQKAGILKDIISLLNGKSKSSMNSSRCLKFMVFAQLPEVMAATEKLISTRKDFEGIVSICSNETKLNNCDKIYVVFINM